MGKVINFMEALNKRRLDNSIEATSEKIMELIDSVKDVSDDSLDELYSKVDKLMRDCLLYNGLIDDHEYKYMTNSEISNIFHNPFDSDSDDDDCIINTGFDPNNCL